MDLHVFGLAVTADQVQSVNAFFIMTMLPLSVVLFNALAKKGYKIRATDKMVVGFLLTALSMVAMSVAGFLAGTKQPAVKVALAEGEIILPAPTVPLDEVKTSDGKTAVAFPASLWVTASDWAYDEDKKKATFANGELTFSDGKKLVIANGRIDFDKSRSVFENNSVSTAGALELKLKPGDYPMGADKLTVGENNAVTIKTGGKVDPPSDKEPPKVSLGDTNWVKPAERVTVWWQILAFFVITLAEILISVTGLELAFVAAPPTMKSFVTACWLVTVGMANLFINAPITRLYPKMDPGIYFLMLAGALAVVTVVFIPVAKKFNRGMAEAEAAKAAEGNTEAV